jgi:hypothetical protein
MTWPADILTTTPKPYRFELVPETGDSVICNIEPLEWKAGTLEMKRDLEVGGVFSSFVVDSLTFITNGADFLTKLFEAKSVNAKCTLIIYYWKAFDAVTPALGRQYVEFPTRYAINFNFYERVKIGRFYSGVRVKAINSSTQTKLDNRQDVEVDITKRTSIGSQTADNIADYTDLKKGLYFDAVDVRFRAKLIKEVGLFQINRDKYVNTYTGLPVDIEMGYGNDFSEIQSVTHTTRAMFIDRIEAFFRTSAFDHELSIDYRFSFPVTNGYSHNPYFLQIIEYSAALGEGTTYDIADFGRYARSYIFEGNVLVTVRKGYELRLVVMVEGHNATYQAGCEYSRMEISEVISTTPATLTEGFPVCEVIERVCQHVLDIQYPVYTDYFARTGIAYKEGVFYSAENQLRFAHIMGGMNLRGAALDNVDTPLALSFKNLFKCLKSVYNVGYSLETLTGETYQRIRIEEYAYFFENTELVFTPTLASRISKYDIQSQVMPELIPVDLKSGYDNFEYLSLNGRGEPNTTNQRTSIMNTATKWENISPFRADTKGIYNNLATPIGSQGSTDTEGDNAIFIIKTQKQSPAVTGQDWIPEKATNVTIDSGSLFKEDLLNRYFTPTRMLRRHANRIAAGLTLFPTSVLKFQKSDKTSLLETTGEGYTTVENADILVSDLATPIYKAMKHTVLVSFTFADLEVLQLYPYKYLKFSDTITGYLLNFKKKNAEDKAEITIIERYIP